MANERTDLMQGTRELLILNTLIRESMHGYGIVQPIHEAAEDLLKVEYGSLLSCPLPDGGTWLDQVRVGSAREQPTC